MLNSGKTNHGTKINVSGTGNYVFIYPSSILTGTISVRDADGNSLWQRINCTSDDIPYALEVAKRGVNTGVFETD